MPEQTTGTRHLKPVSDSAPGLSAPRTVPANGVDWRVTRPATVGQRIKLTAWQRMETEQARELVDTLTEPNAADLSLARLAFAFGRLHGITSNLLDIIDVITDL